MKNDSQEFKNLIAFLTLIKNTDEFLAHPSYIIEKFERYVKHGAKDDHIFGLTPQLLMRMKIYFEKHGIECKEIGCKD